VALLDCTVKVFFLDSLKFFLSLYGHKLPVSTCMSCQTSRTGLRTSPACGVGGVMIALVSFRNVLQQTGSMSAACVV
jgi:hypothetical protein